MAYLTGDGDTLGVIETATGERQEWVVAEQLPPDRYLFTLAMAPDGSEVAVGLGDSHLRTGADSYILGTMVVRFDARTGEVLGRYAVPDDFPPGDTVFYLAYSPDGRFLAATTAKGDDKALLLYDLTSSATEPRVLCRGKDCCCGRPVFTPAEDLLAATCGRRIVLWEVPR